MVERLKRLVMALLGLFVAACSLVFVACAVLLLALLGGVVLETLGWL